MNHTNDRRGEVIALTGASSGIGEALAMEFAARGCSLALAARRIDRIEALRQTILGRYPATQVLCNALDVRDPEAVKQFVDGAHQHYGRLDRVIANAGVSNLRRVGHGDVAPDLGLIQTNVIGAMATIDAAVAQFRKQGFGHAVLLSSVAAVRGLPTASAYCASKAAINAYGEALRVELVGTGIAVTTLFPGYIDTPINQSMKSRPFLIDVALGARIIVAKIERRGAKYFIPGFPWWFIALLQRYAPTRLLARFA